MALELEVAKSGLPVRWAGPGLGVLIGHDLSSPSLFSLGQWPGEGFDRIKKKNWPQNVQHIPLNKSIEFQLHNLSYSNEQ